MHNICILSSGKSRGSNFVAIAEQIIHHKLPIKISFLMYSNLKSPIIKKCSEYKVKSVFSKNKDMEKYEEKLNILIDENEIELIVLAGFMKKFSLEFLQNLTIPIINIHPSLLPKYGGKGMYGMNVHEAIFQANEKKSGATIHFVNQNYDEGKIILQQEVDISDCLVADEIAKKVLAIEHKLYFEGIKKILQIR